MLAKIKAIRGSRFVVPLGIVAVVLLMILPVPPALLDLLIVTNILVSMVILMTAFFVKRSMDFGTFPTILLVMTMFRLSLTVASTRLILGEAHAGAVIQAIGQVTIGGNMVVGIVVFLILALIQFLVITKGSERVAQVAARFNLDAMGGKQNEILAAHSSGAISDAEAERKRNELRAQTDFYGAMDGASNFVKGDNIVSIIVIFVNGIAGLAIGMMMHGMEIGEAASTYAILTIGDGLITQIPALMMALATGVIVTRPSDASDLGSDASKQIFGSPMALYIAAVAAAAMALIPGMPWYFLLPVAAGLGWGGRTLAKKIQVAKDAPEASTTELSPKDPTSELLDEATVHPLALELSHSLVLEGSIANQVIEAVPARRREVVRKLGFLMPAVTIRDSVRLRNEGEYALLVRGVEVARGVVPPGQFFALGEGLAGIPGVDGVEPVFGLQGKWVPVSSQFFAESAGVVVWDRPTIIATHLSEIASRYASQLISRNDVQAYVDRVREKSPSTADELLATSIGLPDLQLVLQGLLAEQVPIRDLTAIFEALTLAVKKDGSPEHLIESARLAIGPQIVDSLVQNNVLAHLMFDSMSEDILTKRLGATSEGTSVNLEPDWFEPLIMSVSAKAQEAADAGHALVFITSGPLRPAVMRLFSKLSLPVRVAAVEEIQQSPQTQYQPYGTISIGATLATAN